MKAPAAPTIAPSGNTGQIARVEAGEEYVDGRDHRHDALRPHENPAPLDAIREGATKQSQEGPRQALHDQGRRDRKSPLSASTRSRMKSGTVTA